MRVRLESDRMAGGAYQQAGDEVDVPTDEAQRLVAGKLASMIETAATTAPEHAATRTQPPAGRPNKRQRGQR